MAWYGVMRCDAALYAIKSLRSYMVTKLSVYNSGVRLSEDALVYNIMYNHRLLGQHTEVSEQKPAAHGCTINT